MKLPFSPTDGSPYLGFDGAPPVAQESAWRPDPHAKRARPQGPFPRIRIIITDADAAVEAGDGLERARLLGRLWAEARGRHAA